VSVEKKMFARRASRGRERGRVNNYVRNDEFRALRREVETLQNEIRRGFARMRDPRSEDDEGTSTENASLDTEQREEIAAVANDPLMKDLTKMGKRPKMDTPTFNGNLDPEELIDWLNEMEEYFEFEEVEDLDRVRFAKTRLKGHASIWWREVQLERGRRGKEKITKWEKMAAKLKRQFIPVDYELDLLKRMQGLKQGNRNIKEYTEEFHKILIKTRYSEENKEKIARYMNGLRSSIQEERFVLF
jgi:hypothetical protein